MTILRAKLQTVKTFPIRYVFLQQCHNKSLRFHHKKMWRIFTRTCALILFLVTQTQIKSNSQQYCKGVKTIWEEMMITMIIRIFSHDFKQNKCYIFGYSAVILSIQKPVWDIKIPRLILLCPQPSLPTQSNQVWCRIITGKDPTTEGVLWQYWWIIFI